MKLYHLNSNRNSSDIIRSSRYEKMAGSSGIYVNKNIKIEIIINRIKFITHTRISACVHNDTSMYQHLETLV